MIPLIEVTLSSLSGVEHALQEPVHLGAQLRPLALLLLEEVPQGEAPREDAPQQRAQARRSDPLEDRRRSSPFPTPSSW